MPLEIVLAQDVCAYATVKVPDDTDLSIDNLKDIAHKALKTQVFKTDSDTIQNPFVVGVYNDKKELLVDHFSLEELVDNDIVSRSSSMHQSTEDKAMEYATGLHLVYENISWQDAYSELEMAVEENRLLQQGILVWQPFEHCLLDNVLEMVNEMADHLCHVFSPTPPPQQKRLLVVSENDSHKCNLANFDASDLEIIHLNYESEFQEPDEMIPIIDNEGVTHLAFAHIDTALPESENSLKVDSVYNLVKSHHG